MHNGSTVCSFMVKENKNNLAAKASLCFALLNKWSFMKLSSVGLHTGLSFSREAVTITLNSGDFCETSRCFYWVTETNMTPISEFAEFFPI